MVPWKAFRGSATDVQIQSVCITAEYTWLLQTHFEKCSESVIFFGRYRRRNQNRWEPSDRIKSLSSYIIWPWSFLLCNGLSERNNEMWLLRLQVMKNCRNIIIQWCYFMYNAKKIRESNRFKPETGKICRLRFILIRKKTTPKSFGTFQKHSKP